MDHMKYPGKLLSFSLIALACLGIPGANAAPIIYPTGTTVYLPEKSQNGYFLVMDNEKFSNSLDPSIKSEPEYIQHWYNKPIKTSEKRVDIVRLMDMNGNVVHTWNTSIYSSANARNRLLPNGHLLHLAEFSGKIVEYDWDGKVVWEYDCDGIPHHDFHVLPNGNYLILAEETVPAEYLAKLKDIDYNFGSRSGTMKRTDAKLVGDTIIEVTPDKKVVWKWKSWEHADINRASAFDEPNDWLHGNTISPIPPNKHFDAGDKRFTPGNIIFNPRNLDEVWIIERETGKIIHTLNHSVRKGLAHPHDPHMIEKGLPGEGNIIIFDNGAASTFAARSGASMVVEMDAITGKSQWHYNPSYGQGFFSPYMAASQKLPNGNVFISEDATGNMLQIKPNADGTPGGEIVWSYVSDGCVGRSLFVPYDYTPQLRNMKKPVESKVSPIDPLTFKILPDAERTGTTATKLIPMPKN